MRRPPLPAAFAFLILAVVALAPSTGSAEVLFSQTPVITNHFASDTDGGGIRRYDEFTLAAPATIERVTWRGVFIGSASLQFPVPFNLRIYPTNAANTGPNTGIVLSDTTVTYTAANQITNTGLTSIGEPIYEFTADLTPAVLAADTRYWFSPQDTGNENFDPFYWGSNESGSLQYFILEGTAVPEPASFALLGLASLTLLRRARR